MWYASVLSLFRLCTTLYVYLIWCAPSGARLDVLRLDHVSPPGGIHEYMEEPNTNQSPKRAGCRHPQRRAFCRIGAYHTTRPLRRACSVRLRVVGEESLPPVALPPSPETQPRRNLRYTRAQCVSHAHASGVSADPSGCKHPALSTLSPYPLTSDEQAR